MARVRLTLLIRAVHLDAALQMQWYGNVQAVTNAFAVHAFSDAESPGVTSSRASKPRELALPVSLVQ